MNQHLMLVREFHDACSFPQGKEGEDMHLSDMDVVTRQALLMERGSQTLRALKSSDMAETLVGLTELAYCSLGALAVRGADVVDRPVSWRHAGSILPLMKLLCDKINDCSEGLAEHYSAVYCVCVHLARTFINADFDKAIRKVHDSYLAEFKATGKSIYDDVAKVRATGFVHAPDLSDCLYE